MTPANIRQKLHQYVESGDENLLQIMYRAAKEYNDDSNKYSFTDADMQLLEERRKKRLSGESKTYSWEEAKKIITGEISA